MTDLLPPGDPELSPDRARVLKEAFLQEITRPGAARRRIPVLLPVAAAATVVLVTLVAGIALHRGSPATPAPGPAPVRVAAPVIALPPVHTDRVTSRADKIATGVTLPPSPTIRADQFVYVRSKVGFQQVVFGGGPAPSDGFTSASEGVVTQALETIRIREMWLPQKGGRGFVQDGKESFELDPISNSEHSAVPADPDQLLRKIYAETKGQGPGPDYTAFDWIGENMYETMLPPQVYVTLFRAAARIPGVVLIDDAVDGAGRHGVAVAYEDQGERREWIFDRRTLVYLGQRNYLVEDTPMGKAGTITGITAVLQRAVVDRQGQRPR